MTRDDVDKNIDAFITLEHHPGWKLLCDQIRKDAELALQAMRSSKTNDELIKHTHTYMTLLAVPDMPRKLYTTLQSQLQAHAKKL